jgi:hypothetical protein
MTLRGRTFSAHELRTIKAIVHAAVGEHRFALSKRVCEALGWRQANGRLKDRSCRDVLARLHKIGFLELPPPRRPGVRRQPIAITERTAPRSPPALRPRDIDRASFSLVTGSGDLQRERLWNEYTSSTSSSTAASRSPASPSAGRPGACVAATSGSAGATTSAAATCSSSSTTPDS